MFPNALSSVPPIRTIDFNKIIPRDDKIIKGVQMSDPLYSHEQHLYLTNKKN